MTIGLYKWKYPGLYFDSAIIEYLASMVVFPVKENMHVTMQYSFIPFLGSIYHGTLSIYFHMLLLLITGSGSVLLLRFSHVVYEWLIFLIYLILKNKANVRMACLMSLVASSYINIALVPRSQVDIMLPGVLCFFIAYYILSTKDRTKRTWWIIGILCGLAFYDYFSFLFLVPMWILWAICEDKKKSIKIGYLYIEEYFLGFILGSLPYVWGFADSICHNLFDSSICKIIIGLLMLSSIIIVIIPMCVQDKRVSLVRKICYSLLVGGFVIALVIGMLNIQRIISGISRFSYVNAMGKSIPITERLNKFFEIVRAASTGSFITGCMFDHEMVMHYWLSLGTKISLLCWLFINAVKIARRKKEINFKNEVKCNIFSAENLEIFRIIGFYGVFYIFSFPMISRMSAQHVEVFAWIDFLLIGFCINSIISKLPLKYKTKEQTINCLLIVAGVAFITLNAHDTVKTFSTLEMQGGGHGYYSPALSEEAKKSKDDNAVYYFADSGFLPSFIYLSNNSITFQIAYRNTGLFDEEELDETILDKYLDDGKTVYFLTWNKDNIIKARKKLSDYKIVEEQECCSNDGKVSFYKSKIDR